MISLLRTLCLALLALLPAALPAAELHVFIWADYIKPELVEKFQQQHQCTVVIDTFDSNESMYAKLRAGASGYDILVPSSYMVGLLQAKGLLKPIDHALLPNLKQAVKDLGGEKAGFEIKPITLPNPGGTEPTVWGVLWSPETAAKAIEKGVPFNKGVMVERKADDNRRYM
jgi:spermidine/putrescine-binding protein